MQKCTGLSGEELFDFWVTNWVDYSFSCKVLNGMFNYLNRHWVKREQDEGKKDICDVYTVSMTGLERETLDCVTLPVTSS